MIARAGSAGPGSAPRRPRAAPDPGGARGGGRRAPGDPGARVPAHASAAASANTSGGSGSSGPPSSSAARTSRWPRSRWRPGSRTRATSPISSGGETGMSPSAYRRAMRAALSPIAQASRIRSSSRANRGSARRPIQPGLDLQVGQPAAPVRVGALEPLEGRVGLAQCRVQRDERDRRDVALPRLEPQRRRGRRALRSVLPLSAATAPEIGVRPRRDRPSEATASRNAAAASSYLPSWR